MPVGFRGTSAKIILWGRLYRGSFCKTINFIFCTVISGLDGYDGGGNFAQSFIRQTNNGYIVNRLVSPEKVFDLDGIQIFTAADDDIFFAVH